MLHVSRTPRATIQLGAALLFCSLGAHPLVNAEDICSKDILSRWTFPLVPDDNHPGGHFYEHLRGNKYIAKDNTVVLSRYIYMRLFLDAIENSDSVPYAGPAKSGTTLSLGHRPPLTMTPRSSRP